MSATAKYFVDSQGNYLGTWDGYIDEDGTFCPPDYPVSAIEVPIPPEDGRQMWDSMQGKYLPLPPQPYQIAKTTPWLRMTQEEARIMDGVMTETDAQMRQVYNAAQYLSSDDQFWQTLHQLIADNLGTARADELLAPEG